MTTPTLTAYAVSYCSHCRETWTVERDCNTGTLDHALDIVSHELQLHGKATKHRQAEVFKPGWVLM